MYRPPVAPSATAQQFAAEQRRDAAENALLADLLQPVPGLSSEEVDVSAFCEVIYAEPDESGKTRQKQRPARGLDSLISQPSRLPESCAICLADFTFGERLRALPCDGAHVFHGQCLKRWLKANPTCPCCRESVRPHPVNLDVDLARAVLQHRAGAAESRGFQRRS